MNLSNNIFSKRLPKKCPIKDFSNDFSKQNQARGKNCLSLKFHKGGKEKSSEHLKKMYFRNKLDILRI